MEAWSNLLTNLGLGMGMVLALLFALWRITAWAGRELVIPIRDRFLDRVDKFFDRLVVNLDRMETSLDVITKRLSDQVKLCNGHSQRLDDIAARLEKK